jgi:hypothetical protein
MDAAKDERTVSQLLRQFDQMRKCKAELVKTGELTDGASVADVVKKLRELLPVGMFTKVVFAFFFFGSICFADRGVCPDGVCPTSPPPQSAVDGGSATHVASSQRVGLFLRLRHARESRRAHSGGGGFFRRFRDRRVARQSERIETPPANEFHRPAAPAV